MIFTAYEVVSLSVYFTTFIFKGISEQSHHPIPYLPVLFLIIAIFIQIRSVNSACFHTDSKYLVCVLLSVYPSSVSREKHLKFLLQHIPLYEEGIRSEKRRGYSPPRCAPALCIATFAFTLINLFPC